ncbi:MAG: hypothetical protein JXR61_00520, partial [Prolixibacteraceae bacterium]|nr:hypothetical protein [Prolixibacteraceae bacterium]
MKKTVSISIFSIFVLLMLFIFSFKLPGDDEGDKKGAFNYKDFQTPQYCQSCHNDFYQQWSQSMMSQAYTHHWDEIEYFKLAVAHAEVNPELKDVVDGCNGCHTPMAYLAGDVTPPRPEEGSRANESVSCEVCHLIKAIEGDTAYNFNWIIEPGQTKYSSRKGDIESPNHKIVATDLF